MPLYRRTSSVNSFNGFPSFGVKPTAACSGQFVFSNSANHLGSNQFSYFICENNTEGLNFGCSPNPVDYLYLNLDNSYLSQGWFIKNDIVAIGENCDGTACEYFNGQFKTFVFSEGNSKYHLIKPLICEMYGKSQQNFCINIISTNSGVKYEFNDSSDTKMKWTSKIEVIQNTLNEKTAQFYIQNIFDSINSGILPENISFDNAYNSSIVMDGGSDISESGNYYYADAGSDDA